MRNVPKLLALLSAIVLATGCSNNNNADSSSSVSSNTSITSESSSAFVEGEGISLENFTNEVNKLGEIPTPTRIIYNYEIHETLTGTWYLATDTNGKRLADGTDVTVTATLTVETGVSNPQPVGEISTNAMRNLVVESPVKITEWMSYQKQNREASQQTNTSLNNFQEKFAINPLKMYMLASYSRVGDGTTIDGQYSNVQEFCRTFNSDGNVKEFTYKEVTEVDGVVQRGIGKPESMKGKWVVDLKCTVQYSFE